MSTSEAGAPASSNNTRKIVIIVVVLVLLCVVLPCCVIAALQIVRPILGGVFSGVSNSLTPTP